MNILYIWDADYPWDVRVEKICHSLMLHGHRVHIASRNLKRNPVYEEYQGLYLHRMRIWNNSKLNYFFSFPAFFNPFWKRLISAIIYRHDIDIIIVRDLPMATAGIFAGKRHKIPVIFDMAEDYVALLKGIWNHSKFKGVNLLLRNPYLAKSVERYVFTHADHIFVVVDEAKKVVFSSGVPAKRISIISNTPELSKIRSYSNRHVKGEIGITIRKRYSAIYTGGIQKGRGIQTVLESIPMIIKTIPDFLFVIVGDGYATEYFKALARYIGIEDFIMWTGWIDHNELYSFINDSKIGLIPHFATEHVNSTVPNKLFDYMSLGLPVLVSDALPLDRIVSSENCGVSYKSGDVLSFHKSFLSIYKNSQLLGINAKNSVYEKYHWERDEDELLRVISTFDKGNV